MCFSLGLGERIAVEEKLGGWLLVVCGGDSAEGGRDGEDDCCSRGVVVSSIPKPGPVNLKQCKGPPQHDNQGRNVTFLMRTGGPDCPNE